MNIRIPNLPIWLICGALVFVTNSLRAQDLFSCDNGKVSFKSDAPLEIIQASSDQLRGIINPKNSEFAFSVDIKTLEGFNSVLQHAHFDENYMETSRFPRATYDGKIIDMIDFSKPGTYNVRSKGYLDIHGVKSERIIPCTLTIDDNSIRVTSEFFVLLSDHDITVPKVVRQKIAEQIKVDVNAVLTLKKQ